MQGHRDLIAWQKAMRLVTDIYLATKQFPKEELYGITAQIRRAAVSVPSSLAEGHGRNSRKEFHHYAGLARGSLLELETQLEIARKIGFLNPESFTSLLHQTEEIGRIVNGLRGWAASAGS